MNFWKPYLGRLVFTALGLITAILFLFIGFAKTVLILLCCGVGYFIGSHKDSGKSVQLPELPEWFWAWRKRW